MLKSSLWASEESYCKEPLELVGNFIELTPHSYAQYTKMIQENFFTLEVLFIEMDLPGRVSLGLQ